MVYSFKLKSQEAKNFLLAIDIDGKHTFYDFHKTIQENTDFQSHQLASFFISDGNWKKKNEISLLDSGINVYPHFTMYKTRISDLIHEQTKFILYTYDLFNDRSFNLELTEIFMERNLNEPQVTLKKGEAPVQILEEETKDEETFIVEEDETLHDFGILEDYTEIFGEMEDF